jgi:hypothetical protein
MKPEPYRWICTPHGIVEGFDFQYWKKSNPPPKDHVAPLVILRPGYYKKGCWISL